MTIERVNAPDPISQLKKSGKNLGPKKKESGDSIQVSEDAKMKAEIYNTIESVKMSPDVREARIEEVKRKLEDPNYISDKVIEEVADKLINYFEI